MIEEVVKADSQCAVGCHDSSTTHDDVSGISYSRFHVRQVQQGNVCDRQFLL